ncbi:Transcriptional regulator KdgR (plasmid) [Variovorax sp. SRS16]|uniref:IclR family transcriptional regulator n=1 Tax=Variovorax sp. SRS16 TaxID=282217 RepID=UPI0013181452|nr:IclR family transcriptional regulator [Variovorax sp. SRS16]VTU46516.1 Transcriptional regulator KdgR [Variovorax sp. SRS16]
MDLKADMPENVGPAATSGVKPIASALKTLALLQTIGRAERPMRLTELAKACGESRATTYQKLVTLVQGGWVEPTEDTRYRLTFLSVLMGQAALEQANIGERATPILQELVLAVGESVSLAEFSGPSVRIVRRIEADVAVRAQVRVGSQLSLDESASGRVLTAFATRVHLQNLKRMNAALASSAVLAEVRSVGYAISTGRDTPGARTLAMPVFDAVRHCIFAISVVAPAERFKAERYKPHLQQAAEKLNAIMGG